MNIYKNPSSIFTKFSTLKAKSNGQTINGIINALMNQNFRSSEKKNSLRFLFTNLIALKGINWHLTT